MRFLTGRMRWVLIFWMFLISAISYLDRVNMSIAGQFLQNELRLSNTQLGYVFSGFMNMGNQIGGTITASLTPLLANQFGWNASLLAAAGLCAIGALAWLFVDPNQKLGVREPVA